MYQALKIFLCLLELGESGGAPIRQVVAVRAADLRLLQRGEALLVVSEG